MRTKIFIAIFSSILLWAHAHCQQNILSVDDDTCKILFIGNSYTGYNDLPGIVNNLAIYGQKNVFVDKFLRYGQPLYNISQLPETRVKIFERKWDFVVLQDGCHNAAYPDSYQALIPYAPYSPLPLTLEIMQDIILDNCDSTRVVYFMPWAFKDGITWIEGQTDTYEDMQRKIYDNSIRFGRELNLIVSPVGWAWYQVIAEKPYIELFNPDLSHPSLDGSYLAACVFYATFFQEELVYSTSDIYLPAERAIYFQSVASTLVLGDRIPLAPTGFTALSNHLTQTSIYLEWNDPSTTINGNRLTNFKIHLYRDGSLIAAIDSGVEKYTDNGLIENVRYTYLIRTVAAMDSSRSVTLNALAGGYIYLMPPSQFTARDSITGIQLRWKNPTKYTDGSPLYDMAYILIYCDGQLFDSLAQTHMDTGQIRTYFDPTEGYHIYRLQARDSDVPPHFSPLTSSVVGYGGHPLSVFKENFETGKGMIYKIGTWDTTSALAFNGRLSFTDSPGGNYTSNSNTYCLLPPVIISEGQMLSFHDIAIVPPPAYAQIEISKHRRETFSLLKKYNWSDYAPWQDGQAGMGDWREEIIDLSQYLGDTITIRFMLQLVSAAAADGWYLDNITIGKPDTVEPVISRTVELQSGWNLISLPLDCEDRRTTSIFPGSVAFTFENCYIMSDSLKTGAGYWIKCDTASVVTITGDLILSDTIGVRTGWNMIGSLSDEMDISGITSVPAGILQSDYYCYDTLYYHVNRLEPGKGYWVKVSENGMLILKLDTRASKSDINTDDGLR